MNRIDRLLAIAITLQSRKYTPADTLAERFGINIRTVYRDLKALDEIGMIFYSMAWYVIGWCWLRNEYRDFKVARILKLQHTYKAFRKTDHQHLNDYIKEQQIKMVLT